MRIAQYYPQAYGMLLRWLHGKFTLSINWRCCSFKLKLSITLAMYLRYSMDTVYLHWNCRTDEDNFDIPPEFLYTLIPPGMPPHELNMKINGIYMLLSNMDVENGLCNCSRFIFRGITSIHSTVNLSKIIPQPPRQFHPPTYHIYSSTKVPVSIFSLQVPHYACLCNDHQ